MSHSAHNHSSQFTNLSALYQKSLFSYEFMQENINIDLIHLVLGEL